MSGNFRCKWGVFVSFSSWIQQSKRRANIERLASMIIVSFFTVFMFNTFLEHVVDDSIHGLEPLSSIQRQSTN